MMRLQQSSRFATEKGQSEAGRGGEISERFNGRSNETGMKGQSWFEELYRWTQCICRRARETDQETKEKRGTREQYMHIHCRQSRLPPYKGK